MTDIYSSTCPTCGAPVEADTDTIRRNDIDARVEAMKDIRRQAIDDCIKAAREVAEHQAASRAYASDPIYVHGMTVAESIVSRLEALKGSIEKETR